MAPERYSITGNGPDLILIHGIGATRQVWDGVIGRLAPHFRCIAYDLPGHGVSEIPARPLSLDDLVADLAALQEHLGIASVHLAGHSLGGMIGPAYALRYPERVRSLGLISTAAFRSDEDRAKVRAVIDGMRARSVAADLGVLTARWFTDAFALRHPEVIAQRRQQVLDTDPEVFLNVFDIYAGTEMAPWLNRVSAPALVLTGAEDGGCNPHLNRQIAAALPDARLCIVPQVKHAILLEAPERVAEELLTFWRDRQMDG
ncbi:alpha/beta fold hydrolase [Pseudogemmobacter humi]|uniref:3-oxoadipate enol-lactonase 2 n=1 Tax=Pseudogemmobacter humi TaxID=2483812 RepID=A0A3P5WZC7_9RHOB|nr:alpha/beta hydrolase [Pseudogemmobacter humi]VDC20264.1 3-oxoadipate enol-lactonase 2 [Pseudogemmobacter humi]